MEYAYKFRLYPNKEQETMIHRNFGCTRFVYNYYLDMRIKLYKEEQKSMNAFACMKHLTQLKKELTWLKEADATALNRSLRDLERAYENFFRRVKKGEKPGFPKFKSKMDRRKSYSTAGSIAVYEDAVKLPKMGLVECRGCKEIQGRILSATVSQTPSGKYYASICCTDVEIPKLPVTGKTVGVDLGIKALATTSDGDSYENNKYLYQQDKRLKRLTKSLSRKQPGSKKKREGQTPQGKTGRTHR